MHNEIAWLPQKININKYLDINNIIDYNKLIEDTFNLFAMDFCNSSSPTFFENKRVVISGKILDCDCLKIKKCYNDEFYNCETCKFKDLFDIFNHICTDDYLGIKKQTPKINVPELKKRNKSKNRKIPRTPGKFNIERVVRTVWIKAIIQNANDCQNINIVKIYDLTNKLQNVNLILSKEKYKISLKPIHNEETGEIKYFVLKTAFFMN